MNSFWIYLSIGLSAFIAGRPSYHASLPTQSIIIDGVIDPTWDQVKWSAPLIHLADESIPSQHTKFKVTYDDDHIYFLISAIESDIQAKVYVDGQLLHDKDDALELFLDINADGQDYLEVQVNAAGALCQIHMTKPYNEGGKPYFTPVRLDHAIGMDGTINDSTDTDRSWWVEIAIPNDGLTVGARGCISPILNIARVEQVADQQEYQSWAPMGDVNLHQPHKWGLLYLSSQK